MDEWKIWPNSEIDAVSGTAKPPQTNIFRIGKHLLFKIMRKSYVRKLYELGRQENTESFPVSLTFSIKQYMLEYPADFPQLGEEVTEVDDITDFLLRKWLGDYIEEKNENMGLSALEK